MKNYTGSSLGVKKKQAAAVFRGWDLHTFSVHGFQEVWELAPAVKSI
jgi:hypothetical protein